MKVKMQQYMRGNGESPEWVSVQDVSPCVVDDDIRPDLIQRPLTVKLHFLQVLCVLSAPVQLHLPLYGPFNTPTTELRLCITSKPSVNPLRPSFPLQKCSVKNKTSFTCAFGKFWDVIGEYQKKPERTQCTCNPQKCWTRQSPHYLINVHLQ